MSWMPMILALSPVLDDPHALDALGTMSRAMLREHIGCMAKREADLQDQRRAIRQGTLFSLGELREGTKDRLHLLAELQVDEGSSASVRKLLVPAFEQEERALREHIDLDGGSAVLRVIATLEAERLDAARQIAHSHDGDVAGEVSTSEAPLAEGSAPQHGAAPDAREATHAPTTKPSKPPASAPDTLRAADNLYKLGKFAEALDLYAQVPLSPAVEPFLLYRRGECLLRLNRYEQGIQLLTKASKADPDNTWSKQAGRSLQIAESLRKLPKAPKGGK